ncbi:VAPA [Bugula neritina]|uniref:VAPA n=1 Tax=Bugula neritina TaxID=10212 RepID=A0A7J7JQ76_BUGNE|nr:VAPA [Bugula neritina]
MPRLSQVLKIDPPEALEFKGPFTEVVTSNLILQNPTDSRVAFKVKTTAPKRYCVRPNSGVLDHNESVTVSVMLQPFEYDPLEKTKHKFMIQSLVMAGDVDEKDVWKAAEPSQLMDTKLRVVFNMDSTVPESPAQPAAPLNDLDSAGDHVQMTPQKANVKMDSEKLKQAAPGGTSVDDEAMSRAKLETKRLLDEISSLRKDNERMRKLAMSDTMTSSSQSQQLQKSSMPSGVSLLFQDTSNIVLLFFLFIVAFSTGLFTSNLILGR